jgi:hypothetical protein
MEQTLGQTRVRVDSDPTQGDVAGLIKQKSAELIDLCETLKPLDPRLASIAQTEYESACHWAVKAATAGK